MIFTFVSAAIISAKSYFFMKSQFLIANSGIAAAKEKVNASVASAKEEANVRIAAVYARIAAANEEANVRIAAATEERHNSCC